MIAPQPPSTGYLVYKDDADGHLYALYTDGTKTQLAPASAGGGGFIQTLTAPVSGNFTQKNFNVGAGVVSTQVNNSTPVTSITIKQHDTSTNNMIALVKAKLASTFTITIGFSCAGASSSNYIAGLYLDDGGAGPNIIHWTPTQPGFGTRISVYSNFTNFSSDIVSNSGQMAVVGPLVWYRIQETNANRIYSVSSDNITYSQVFSEANNAHFTTSNYGFAVANRTGSSSAAECQMTVYSFVESNP